MHLVHGNSVNSKNTDMCSQFILYINDKYILHIQHSQHFWLCEVTLFLISINSLVLSLSLSLIKILLNSKQKYRCRLYAESLYIGDVSMYILYQIYTRFNHFVYKYLGMETCDARFE